MSSVEIVDSIRSLYPLKDFEEEAIMEVLKEFRELKEKATAKKPIPIKDTGGMFDCPHCKRILLVGTRYKHCTWCGGLLDQS